MPCPPDIFQHIKPGTQQYRQEQNYLGLFAWSMYLVRSQLEKEREIDATKMP